jgi:hypothetical protein
VSHPNLVLLGLRNVLLVVQTFVLLCLRNVFVSHASVMHPNHMSDYIYCVYVSKMHRKSFFYEITTHLI